MSVLLHVCRNYEQKDQNNNKKTISILFWECLWMIFCDPLESGSLQSDSNQIRTAVSTVLSPLAHTKHHSYVNGTHIVMATCHWASCRTELPETENTPSQLKTIRIWKNPPCYSRSINRSPYNLIRVSRKKRQCFHSSVLFSLSSSLSTKYNPIWPRGEWYKMVWNVFHA